MEKLLRLLLIESLLALSLPAQTSLWRRSDCSLARLDGAVVIWQVVADPAQGKPYFHPLATPGGTLLTDLRPADHPWHRGLWWSWKFINGLNYWEEDRPTGRSEAATELTGCTLDPHEDGSAVLTFALSYHPWNVAPILTEQRTIRISNPVNGRYELLWQSEFTAVSKVTLARTPPPDEPSGKPFGGYAGLSLRFNPITKGWTFSSSEGLSGVEALHGQRARWIRFSAGPDRPAVTIFDDEQNRPGLTPWYVNQKMPFMSPAPLFSHNRELAPGEKLILRYRISITDHDPK